MIKQSILAQRPTDLTLGWAQRVVNQRFDGIVVSGISILSVDIGTTTRVRLAVEHNGPPNLPRRWFVKLPSLAWRARLITALPGLLHNEVRFYKEAAQIVPASLPDFLAAESEPGRGATLVLRDVTESGAVVGNPDDILTAAQAALVVAHLARFHAHFWDKADVVERYHWLAGPVRRVEDRLGAALALPLMKRGLYLAGQIVPCTIQTLALRYARHRARIMRFLSNAPQTIVHHDCHPGNLFWIQSQPGFLDWQLVRFGEGIGDVAYFLATALSPEVRRAYEVELVTAYAEALRNHGVTGIDIKGLMHRYRAHLIYPFEAMLVTLAVGGMMKLESNYELIHRAAVAVEELDAFAEIGI